MASVDFSNLFQSNAPAPSATKKKSGKRKSSTPAASKATPSSEPPKKKQKTSKNPASITIPPLAERTQGFPKLKSPNPYLDAFNEWKRKSPRDMKDLFNPELDGGDDRRAKLFELIDPDIPEKYAWAVPDARAIDAVAEIAPKIVEIGAGRGYWGRLLLEKGVDWIGFDVKPNATSSSDEGDSKSKKELKNWCSVLKGGPGKLRLPDCQDRALMLCYPDDYEDSSDSMASKCLDKFHGDTVIHIGELMVTGTLLENPWGKTSAPDFQTLSQEFHCVLQLPLPAWPGSIDYLTVWKRTQRCEVDEDMAVAHIPPSEALLPCAAAPAFQHLLASGASSTKKRKGKKPT